ncbi:MAG TPA: hypothetical protein VFJ85_02935 [Acidimicrobiales bacterium]|nr:hypothetical protein [Acidimicrobiales bacterium]
MSDDCPTCGGTGVVTVSVHAATCHPLRCSKDCPATDLRRCGRCEQAALGEDLVS